MKKKLLSGLLCFVLTNIVSAQDISVFNDVPFYSMYHYLGEGQNLPAEAYSQIPAGAIRLHAYERDVISRKLSPTEISGLGKNLTIDVTITAACDNYDRLAGISLALVPKGQTTYTWDQTDIKRIEIARFITPFMNKNISPTSIPYKYQANNIVNILRDPIIMQNYDAWIEFRADGYSAAANTQVTGCADRTDVFRGNLKFTSTGEASSTDNFFLPISYREPLNNYNATDEAGTTTKTVNFTLQSPVNNAILYLISSNHGANAGGEEYNRRDHFVYLDNQLVHQYKPGGKTCEPLRQYNTQSNGIYGASPRTLRTWLSMSNWCPGDAIPNREVKLGNLAAGQHTIQIKVPSAVFPNKEGNIPVSMYIQNNNSGQIICATANNLKIDSQIGQTIKLNWDENSNTNQAADNWQVLYGRMNNYGTTYDKYLDTSTTEASLTNLNANWYYESYVKGKCANGESEWVGPVFSNRIELGTQEQQTVALSIYPNPTKDFINIKSDLKIKNVVIYSIDGKKITEASTQTINVSKLTNGTYLVSIILESGEVINQKFIKN